MLLPPGVAPPDLRGERVRLRPLTRQDLPDRIRWLSDPSIAEGVGRVGPPTLVQETRWWEGLDRRDSELSLVIEDEEGVSIGNAGLRNIHWRRGVATLGFFIGERSRWRRGYGREALDLLLGYAFRDLGLREVLLTVQKDNAAAVGLYEAVGFRTVTERMEDVFRDGRWRPVLHMHLTASDWSAARPFP